MLRIPWSAGLEHTKINDAEGGLSALPAARRDRVLEGIGAGAGGGIRTASIPSDLRPSFKELEAAARGGGCGTRLTAQAA